LSIAAFLPVKVERLTVAHSSTQALKVPVVAFWRREPGIRKSPKKKSIANCYRCHSRYHGGGGWNARLGEQPVRGPVGRHVKVSGGGRFLLLASSSVAALLIAARAAAFAQCAIAPVTNQSSVRNSTTINSIFLAITVTGSVTNSGSGVIAATTSGAPSRTGITLNSASVGGAIINARQTIASAERQRHLRHRKLYEPCGITNSGTISGTAFSTDSIRRWRT
jgi:hypothetical protein